MKFGTVLVVDAVAARAPMFWTMNDMPTAVISGASRGRVAQRPVGDALDRRR